MWKFNRGDRVKLVSVEEANSHPDLHIGMVGTITKVACRDICICFDKPITNGRAFDCEYDFKCGFCCGHGWIGDEDDYELVKAYTPGTSIPYFWRNNTR